MKKKKNQALPLEQQQPVDQDREAEEQFTLEDILKEFGGDQLPKPETTAAEPADSQAPTIRFQTIEPDSRKREEVGWDTFLKMAEEERRTEAAEKREETNRQSPPAPAREASKRPRPPRNKVPSEAQPPDAGRKTEHKEPLADSILFGGAQPFSEQKTSPEQGEQMPAEREDRRKAAASRSKTRRKPAPIVTPEALYRESSHGIIGIKIRLVICFLLALTAIALSLCRANGWLAFNREDSFPNFTEMALLLICSLLSYDVLAEGVSKILRLRFQLTSLLTVAVILALIDGSYCLTTTRATYCPVVCLLLSAALWGSSQTAQATCGTMDVGRRAVEPEAVLREPALLQKRAGVLRGKGSLAEFMVASQRPAGPDRLLSAYGLALLLLSAAGAGLTCQGNLERFVQNWTAILLAGIPVLSFVTVSRPWAILTRRLQKLGAALCGWEGARRLAGSLVVPVSDYDLFPPGSLKMNGVKFFGLQAPDKVVSYGAAVTSTAGSGLQEIFREQMELRNARRYVVGKLRRYENGGVGAEIGLDSVLVGSLRFMQSMGVDMPAGTRVSQAVYVAINGELSGVFAVHYGVTRGAMEGLNVLTHGKGLTPVLTAGDFIITDSFLRSRFRVKAGKIQIPPLPVRSELAEREPSEKARQCVLLTKPGFASLALSVAGARALHTAASWGAIVNLISGIMGMAIMTVLAHLAALEVMSVSNLLLFLLVWAVPSLLLSGWTRNI